MFSIKLSFRESILITDTTYLKGSVSKTEAEFIAKAFPLEY